MVIFVSALAIAVSAFLYSAARQEELSLKEENRRNAQEAEQKANKTGRQTFFQDPFVTIGFGFGVIIGLYLALF